MCIVCKSVVRSEDVWKVHINTKVHKQNVELAKELAKKPVPASISMPPPSSKPPVSSATATKRMAPPTESEVPAKIPKGILKNSIRPTNVPATQITPTSSRETNIGSVVNDKSELPDNFFDNPSQNPTNFYEATLTKTSIKTNLVSIRRNVDSEDANVDAKAEQQKDEALPEGFFDDPIKDAKARNSEYRDPVEEEWEKFQQEIKTASDFSNAIIAEDQEEAITERQIDEIDEQIRNWNR